MIKTNLTILKLLAVESALLSIAEMQLPTVTLFDGLGRPRSEVRSDRIKLPGKVSVPLRKNLCTLETALKGYKQAREDMIAKHSEDGTIDLDAARINGKPNEARKEFLKEWKAEAEKTIELELETIPEKEIESLNIPVLWLRDISPLLA